MTDEMYMRRCLQLARCGRQNVKPNPMVGAVIVATLHLPPSTLHLPPSTPLIVLTGGEPTLQVDETFVDLLHRHGLEVAMESNGTRPAPKNLDWLTVSPKVISIEDRQDDEHRRLPDELKIVFDENADPEKMLASCNTQPSTLLYLQPCDTGDGSRNAAIIEACVDYIKKHPQWRLSLQTHKLIGIE